MRATACVKGYLGFLLAPRLTTTRPVSQGLVRGRRTASVRSEARTARRVSRGTRLPSARSTFQQLQMVRTESAMVELGTVMPAFALPDVTTGEIVSLDSLYADSPPPKALVVVFLAAHCPFVKHIAGELSRLSADISSGKFGPVKMVGISSNFVGTHPDDAPERMAEEIKTRRYQFPILYDETQDVARGWKAACTPDFYLLDHERKLFYRGRLDGSRPGNDIPVTGEDLRNAIQLCVNGQSPPENQLPSIGCSIKWKPS
ncbi:hypothetical protein, conserved [Cyanidioschyzon merolae strain 10D]|uniref:Thioredoxin domain-containing protein n=1 Tax=Cyanidioschyzon merolae (strain NIES-3377 / 10D) TaxID=280699 RepID=M1VK10_CYAM1|nr:hypothetical protein, conserved [Cyanidioschyzon merolae strain 10D]BAM81733.1 hypothetical protein, conserved [Cyanidioschyzon merolae strain 10D]|eukprot:XP_005537769.1 hypothetical protein, conserved [Cyanidioschyzon merolae strain 10D]